MSSTGLIVGIGALIGVGYLYSTGKLSSIIGLSTSGATSAGASGSATSGGALTGDPNRPPTAAESAYLSAITAAASAGAPAGYINETSSSIDAYNAAISTIGYPTTAGKPHAVIKGPDASHPNGPYWATTGDQFIQYA